MFEDLVCGLGPDAGPGVGYGTLCGQSLRPHLVHLDTGVFLEPGQQPVSSAQVRLAVAFAVPAVSRIAVGTTCPDHLAELAAASSLAVSTDTVYAYCRLLREQVGGCRREAARATHDG
ncbi:hypothetical protein [Streptomyces sp. NPDC055632]